MVSLRSMEIDLRGFYSIGRPVEVLVVLSQFAGICSPNFKRTVFISIMFSLGVNGHSLLFHSCLLSK